MTKELMEKIRVRIMSEAYDLADRNDSEGYNAIKVMCSDVLAMIEEPEQDFDAIAERQLASLKRATRKTLEDATVRAVQKMADEPQPKQEPWATREYFYRELNRSVEHMREQMEIKSVTMRCTDYDLALPVIRVRDGHVLVGQVTTPPPRPWVGLTDEEIAEIGSTPSAVVGSYVHTFARAIENKLRSKNT